MNDDNRLTWGLIIDVLDVLDKHGYHSAGHQHTGQAVGLIGDLAHIYEGVREAPAGAYPGAPLPPQQAAAGSPERPAGEDAVTVSTAELGTILAALDEAADVKRDRAANCADCADGSCGTCEFRLRTARAYESAAACLLASEQASKPAAPDRQHAPGGSHPGIQRLARPEAEAGQ